MITPTDNKQQFHWNTGTVVSVQSVRRCYKQDKFEAASWGQGPRRKGMSSIVIRCQVKASEDFNSLRIPSAKCAEQWKYGPYL
jgi:hypothetical protein